MRYKQYITPLPPLDIKEKTIINYTFYGLDILVKGSLFIWLYRALGLTELVSFPTLFLAIGVEIIVFLITAVVAFTSARRTMKKAQEQVDDFLNNYEIDTGYEYYDE